MSDVRLHVAARRIVALRDDLEAVEGLLWAVREVPEVRGGAPAGIAIALANDSEFGLAGTVWSTDADRAKLREALTATVLPGWVKRCGAKCGEIYNQAIAPISGVKYAGQ